MKQLRFIIFLMISLLRKKMFYSITVIIVMGIVSPAVADTIIFQPADGKDAAIYEQLPNDNFGSSNVVYSWPCCGDVKGLIEFDISSLNGTTVNNASLSLLQWWNYPKNLTLGLYRITSPWDESSVTWNTMPSVDSTPVSTLTITDGYSAAWRTWNVTSIIGDWASGTYDNYGLMISRISGTEYAGMLSSENNILPDSYDPQLAVNYTVVPEPISSILFITGGTLLAGRRFMKKKA